MYYVIEVDYNRLFDDKLVNAYYAIDRGSGGCPYFSSTPIESQVRTFTTPEDAIKFVKEELEDPNSEFIKDERVKSKPRIVRTVFEKVYDFGKEE